jgi:hypothetical protein
MKKIIIIAILQILICKTYGQNYPFRLYGGGLDGSTYQQSVIYSDVMNGLLIEAPIDPNNNKLPVSFSWRGGGIPSLFIGGDSKIGIGTATPEVKLDVLSSNVAAFFRSTANVVPVSIINSGSSISTVGFKGSTSASEYNVRVGADGNDFIVYSNNVERMRVLSGGNVGIGTINPINRFESVGNESTLLEAGGFYNTNIYGNANDKAETRINLGKIEGSTRQSMGSIGAFPENNTDSSRGSLVFYTRESQTVNERLRIISNGNVGIGTTTPDAKLAVNGNIHAKEVKIDLSVPAPDYVFANDYKLKTLQEVEEFIKKNSHLPEIPSAKEFEKNGLMLAEMNISLLKKMEEMTLYMIEQNKISHELMEKVEKLEKASKKQ